jgi:hypothetical protein
MKEEDFVLIEPIIEHLVQKISEQENISPFEALELFYQSKTYQMLIDPDMYLWDLSNKGLFDLWKVEQKTGDPRQSVYLQGDTI